MYSFFLFCGTLASLGGLLAGLLVCGSGLSPIGGSIIIYGAGRLLYTFIGMTNSYTRDGRG